MTDINILIKQFVNSKRHSREERKIVYELACIAADLYHENQRLKYILEDKNRLLYPNFGDAILEESRIDG